MNRQTVLSSYSRRLGSRKYCWTGAFGLPWWPSGKEAACECKRCGLDPWVGRIPWRRKWQPTPVFLLGKSHAQRSLADYSPWSWQELDTNEVTGTYSEVLWPTWVNSPWLHRESKLQKNEWHAAISVKILNIKYNAVFLGIYIYVCVWAYIYIYIYILGVIKNSW